MSQITVSAAPDRQKNKYNLWKQWKEYFNIFIVIIYKILAETKYWYKHQFSHIFRQYSFELNIDTEFLHSHSLYFYFPRPDGETYCSTLKYDVCQVWNETNLNIINKRITISVHAATIITFSLWNKRIWRNEKSLQRDRDERAIDLSGAWDWGLLKHNRIRRPIGGINPVCIRPTHPPPPRHPPL